MQWYVPQTKRDDHERKISTKPLHNDKNPRDCYMEQAHPEVRPRNNYSRFDEDMPKMSCISRPLNYIVSRRKSPNYTESVARQNECRLLLSKKYIEHMLKL